MAAQGPRGRRQFVPALGFRLANPLFDPLVRLTLRERHFKLRLVQQMRIAAGQPVLDVGCGTGTLALIIKHTYPGAEVIGLDPDPQLLAMARRKAERSGAHVRFELGYADRLPHPDNSLACVTSSLVFHHLSSELKAGALLEVFRVLRPGGELQVADFGRPKTTLMRVALVPVRLVDGTDTTRDNVAGRLPVFMSEAGFVDVAETARFNTLFGPVCLYNATKPRSQGTGADP